MAQLKKELNNIEKEKKIKFDRSVKNYKNKILNITFITKKFSGNIP